MQQQQSFSPRKDMPSMSRTQVNANSLIGQKTHIHTHTQADKTNLDQRNPNQVCPQPKSLNQPPQATDTCTSILNRSWIIRSSGELHRQIKQMTSFKTVMLKACQNHREEPLDLSCSVLMASHNYSWYYYPRSWPAIFGRHIVLKRIYAVTNTKYYILGVK